MISAGQTAAAVKRGEKVQMKRKIHAGKSWVSNCWRHRLKRKGVKGGGPGAGREEDGMQGSWEGGPFGGDKVGGWGGGGVGTPRGGRKWR